MTAPVFASYYRGGAIVAAIDTGGGRGMARKTARLAVVLIAAALLSACDKCTGGLQDIQIPLAPRACSR